VIERVKSRYLYMNTCIYGVRVYTGITDVDGPIRLWTVLDPPGRFRVIPISGCIHFNKVQQFEAHRCGGRCCRKWAHCLVSMPLVQGRCNLSDHMLCFLSGVHLPRCFSRRTYTTYSKRVLLTVIHYLIPSLRKKFECNLGPRCTRSHPGW
jgi:hypothetical protein